MAQCKQTPQEFIKNVFTPQIAVLTTQEADLSCKKNNLSFIDLLQPFSKLNSDVHYKDPNGVVISIRNMKLTFLDVNSRPPQTTLARKFLNNSVSEAQDPRETCYKIGGYSLDIPSYTPWYEAWRDTFLRVQYPSDHEYTKHFLACMLVASSNDPNPLEAINQLNQQLIKMQSTAPGKLPKWFSSNILKYYVILEDIKEPNTTIITEAISTLKSTYGASNCFLLGMNSRPPGSAVDHFPDPWSQFISNKIDGGVIGEKSSDSSPNSARSSMVHCEVAQEANENKSSTFVDYHPLSPDTEDLTMHDIIDSKKEAPVELLDAKTHGKFISNEDVEQIKLMIFEFTRSCLMPYISSQMVQLNDVVSNKKGMSKSLFSATKRWFSTSKPGTGGSSSSSAAVALNNLIYAIDAPELQVRKLGDLYFMFGNYAAAFQAYHLAKRDYNTDQAWLYYAGALEMAALSAFMSGDWNRKAFDYMEESIITYLNTCKLPQFATRATILSSECLKFKSQYGDAALHLIRMTSEDSDLRSALLLEQAAYCFLQSKMVRKYAFHMVLAGHRFSKAAQKKHTLRSYKQAFSIYENTGWDLATDHIHYTIGRQANILQQYHQAVSSFSNLLTESSKQTAQQQALFLKEYLTILSNKLKSSKEEVEIPLLPVPKLESDSIKVLVGPSQPLTTPGRIPAAAISFDRPEDAQSEVRWNRLEEMLVTEAEGNAPMIFKPTSTLHTFNKLQKNLTTNPPMAIVNEPIQIQITMANILQTVLNLKDIYLIWTFSSNESEIISNDVNTTRNTDDFVKTHVNKAAIIEGNQKLDVTLSLTPLVTGKITILGVCYTITTTDTIFIKGKQFIDIPTLPTKSQAAGTTKLEINVVPSAPCLQVTFSELNLDLLTNEMQRVSVELKNSGSVGLKNILMATSSPNLLSSCEFKSAQYYPGERVMSKEKWARKNHITSVPLAEGKLEPDQNVSIHLWVKAPNVKGPAPIDLLLYYENMHPNAIPKYRLVRHSWNLTVQESISMDITLQESHNSNKVEELVMAIKATNLNEVHSSISTEVTLLNIGVYSKYWKLMKNIVTPKYINLSTQESAHILLKSKRVNKEKPKFSIMPLYSSERKHIQHLNNACLSFAVKTEQYKSTLTESESIASDFDSDQFKDGLVFLQWQALVTDATSKKIVYGQNLLPLQLNRYKPAAQITREVDALCVDINDKLSEKIVEHHMKILQKQLTYNLLFTSTVLHDFNKKTLCIVPVKLQLHSVSEEEILVTVNTIDTCVQINYLHANIAYPLASSQFRWLGKNKIMKKMYPLSTSTVRLNMAVSGPGIFNLGARIQILCRPKDCSNVDRKNSVVQSCELQSSLVVKQVENLS
ncbi:unnamed protein product [Brassicogethes aeneus]|uniref:Trafficking protein particle complex subunit 8 n=1 Tax=Brassicogethes aeneus TaxID=1431903 RepID=A0A9P0BF16_BRAAE|nr:unnamed protein product [Brassicogethes aeneus]